MSNLALAFSQAPSRVPRGFSAQEAVTILGSTTDLGEGIGCLIFVSVWP